MAVLELDDKYARDSGQIFLSGTQALVRLPVMQSARDAAAGLNTAGFITGYRGSPLGGYDIQLRKEAKRLEAARVHFEPGVNEDLAATAVWGTQQATLLPGSKYDGVFAIWYGKGPGVDRAGDPIKHGNRMGTSKHGGVLVVFGDDHGAKSSTTAHQSEQALVAHGVPILYPATVQEFLEYGLHGFALSRYSGLWVGFKCVNETVETTATVCLDSIEVRAIDFDSADPPAGGIHARFAFDPVGDDVRLARYKLPRAQDYVRAHSLDRVTHDSERRELGIISAGKSWLDVREALRILELDGPRAGELGVRAYKPAMIWPLESQALTSFAQGHRELLLVEEKADFLEGQVAHALYNLSNHARPRLVGKRDEAGRPLLPADIMLEPLHIACVIGERLRALGAIDSQLAARLEALHVARDAILRAQSAAITRPPYFCSGCPHNTSTKIPEGSLALAGIGCHTMAMSMNRATLPPTQMGGEGVNWTGIHHFSDLAHVFQNLGDGTYFHSGLLAIRAAVSAGANITYKLLINDAVAMTGGQAVEGGLSVAEITHQLRAERVQRIAVVTDNVKKFRGTQAFARGVTLHDRSELDAVQRELRNTSGVTALIYDQVCAAEKRRRRKRATLAEPKRRIFINQEVCEGCGDCSVQSNCLSIEPRETQLGRKRRIDQSSCNKDYSCATGFCPAFVAVEGPELRKSPRRALAHDLPDAIPEPIRATPEGPTRILVTGIGGTGVVTIGALLGTAAHLEGQNVTVFDMTGVAQKGGAVLSHVQIASDAKLLTTPRIGPGAASVVIGCDLVVTASAEGVRAIGPQTRLVVNTNVVPTGAFQLDPNFDLRDADVLQVVMRAAGASPVHPVPAGAAALRLLGDTLGSNMFLVGFSLQKGWLPISRASIERAIEINGVAVSFNQDALMLGRMVAHRPELLSELLSEKGPRTPAVQDDLADLVKLRERLLTQYQDADYGRRYTAKVKKAAEVERERVPGQDALAKAFAVSYYKLLAYKDEYEVARLFVSPEFREDLDATFAGTYRLRYYLAPPFLARRNPVTGEPRKMIFGPWMRHAFVFLAGLKRIRGTALDPFGWTAERRMERQLIRDYERMMEELLSGLNEERHELAVEIARLPELIRGFGHVKQQNVQAFRTRAESLQVRWRETENASPPSAPRVAAH
jgi:indolepyruvate ferredoxin oxidoreductase